MIDRIPISDSPFVDDHFVPQLAEQATDPGRMRSCVQCDPTARHRAEYCLQRLGRGGDFLFHHDASGFVQNALTAGTIPQIQTDGHLLLSPDRLRVFQTCLMQAICSLARCTRGGSPVADQFHIQL
jgi:hypothetical protein